MKNVTKITIIVVAVIVVGGLIWWYLSMSPSYTAPATTSQATTTTPSAPASTIVLGSNTQFPSYLEAANGMALYTYNKDTTGVSNCTGSCAAIWPPYSVSSASGLSAGSGISGTIGAITRPDGTVQVTYNGSPLYFFAKDTSTGDVTGNGVGGFSVAMTTSQAASKPKAAPPQPAASANVQVQTVPAQTTPAPVPTAPAPYTPPSGYNY